MDPLVHSVWGGVHFGLALMALVAGPFALSLRKGGRGHRRWGYLYAGSMTAQLLATIPDAAAGLSAFHYMAIFSGLTLTGGLVFIRRAKQAKTAKARAGLVWGHYKFMVWSYAGLVAAGASQIATRIAFGIAPSLTVFWLSVLFASLGTMLIAAIWISRADRAVRARHAGALDASQA